MDIKEIISDFNHLTETEHDKNVRILREEFLRKEETGENMVIPGEFFHEVVYGEKSDPSSLLDIFDENGNYIGPDIELPEDFKD